MVNNIIKTSVITAFIFISTLMYSQNKNINMIILVDEKICFTIQNVKLFSDEKTSEKSRYIVGDLTINEPFYDSLMGDYQTEIKISFDAILSNEIYPLEYKIVIPKSFFKQDYIIVNIYNLKNKLYKKRYSKLVKNGDEYYTIIQTPISMSFK